MKGNRIYCRSQRRLRVTVLATSVVVAPAVFPQQRACATLFWDSDASPTNNNTATGANLGGSGAWGPATNWYDGAVETTWTPGGDAVFFGPAGTVTLASSQSASSLTFKTTGYNVTASTLTMTPPAPTFTVDPGILSTLSSTLAGTGTMTKLGAGTLVLANPSNTNTAATGIGGWLISAGTLQLGSDGAFGISPGTGVTDIQLNQSTIQANASFQEDITRRTKINTNSSTNLGDAVIDTHGFAVTWTGSIQGGPGSLLVTNTGPTPGIFILGTDKLNNINPWGSTLPAGTVNLTVTGGAIVQTSGTTTPTGGELGSETGAGGAVLAINLDNGQIRSESGGYSFQRNLILGPGNGSLDVGAWGQTFLGTVSGAGALTKFGTATLVIAGSSSTWTGGTFINVGTLQIGQGGSNGFLPGDSSNHYPIHIASGASLFINNSSSPSIFADIDGQGSLTAAGPNRVRVLGTWTYAGQTTVTAGALTIQTRDPVAGTPGTIAGPIQLNGGNLDYNSAFASTYAGVISPGPSGASNILSKDTGGTGKFTLTGSNTYTGDTIISGPSSNASTLEIGNGGATGSIDSPFIHDGGVLQFNRSNDLTYAGTITDYPSATYAATTAGSGSVVKTGTGTLTLSGNNTYSNGTTVLAGNLRVANSSGSATGSGPVSVNSSATLSGNGAIAGSVSVLSGAHLAPGTSPGVLTLGGLSLIPGSQLDFELATPATGSDRTIITNPGALSITGGTLNITALTGFGIGHYTLLDYTTSFTGSASNLSIGSAPSGFTYSFIDNPTATSIDLVVVPEPAIFSLTCGLTIARLARRRRPHHHFSAPASNTSY